MNKKIKFTDISKISVAQRESAIGFTTTAALVLTDGTIIKTAVGTRDEVNFTDKIFSNIKEYVDINKVKNSELTTEELMRELADLLKSSIKDGLDIG